MQSLRPCTRALLVSVAAFCHARESLQSLCSLITGDALLYSMFRVEATPVECPFKGPLSFTYNRGHGECHSPVSSIDSCTEESRLLLRYQACPDVHGTESTGKETLELLWEYFQFRYMWISVPSSLNMTSFHDLFISFRMLLLVSLVFIFSRIPL